MATLLASSIQLGWETTAAQTLPDARVQDAVPDEARRALDLRKAQLDVEKLERESEKLKREVEKIQAETKELIEYTAEEWGRFILGLIFGPIGIVAAAWLALRGTLNTAQRSHEQSIDTAKEDAKFKLGETIHAKRTALYPAVLHATAPLAIYFPTDNNFDRLTCRAVGRALSKWYFDEGGLYLSARARDCYFLLAAALNSASRESEFALKSPSVEERNKIDDSKIEVYRLILKLTPERFPNSDSLRTWTFGQRVPTATVEEIAKTAEDKKLARPTDETIREASRFQDYVLLQTFSSWLRAALTEDLESRSSPTKPHEQSAHPAADSAGGRISRAWKCLFPQHRPTPHAPKN